MVLQLALERGNEEHKFSAVLWEREYKSKKRESETSYFREKRNHQILKSWSESNTQGSNVQIPGLHLLLIVNALFLLIHYANTYATFYEAKVKTNQALL